MGNDLSRPSNSSVQIGLNRQPMCWGCRQVEILLAQYSSLPESRKRRAHSRVLLLHADCRELDECARRCTTCRLFRQAVFLKCTTTSQAACLLDELQGKPVYVSFAPVKSRGGEQAEINTPDIILEIPGSKIGSSMRVHTHPTDDTRFLDINPDPVAHDVRQQLNRWIQTCDQHHTGHCRNLAWSSRLPSRLVHVSDEGVRLMDPDQNTASLRYVALSYSWGTQAMTEAESDFVQKSRTTTQNVEARHETLDLAELPATVKDALQAIKHLGMSYLWVDSLCIVQDSEADWTSEASKMHEYYGNAYFTLCISSTTKATEPLIQSRIAWSLGSSSCRLNGQWLSVEATLHDVRAFSPLAQRAWTLQEEHLSPRILYWTPHRFYWSCAYHELEEKRSQTSFPDAHSEPIPRPSDYAQAFLLSLRGGSDDMHTQWFALLESYTKRSMTQYSDVFPALAGLAARYLGGKSDDNELYLAGLWKTTFAIGLAWAVAQPATSDKENNRFREAPSWSWASLPPSTPTKMVQTSGPAADLSLVEISSDTAGGDSISNQINRGARVREVQVCGRLRPMWRDCSVLVPWSGISQREKSGNEVFTFATVPEQDVHAVSSSNGLIVAYEAHKKELVGQLDYTCFTAEVAAGTARLWALEVGKDAMIILQQESCDEKRYSRRGFARMSRLDFFNNADKETLWLV